MGILGIFQLGALLLGGDGSVAAAFQAAPSTPERIEEAARPRDAGLVMTTWSQRDGLPAGPDYLATTAGGMLLFAAEDRIHRFDGSRFSAVEGADGAPLVMDAVMGSGRGGGDDVWFRTRSGQAARIGSREVQRFGEESGFLKNTDIRQVLVAGADTVAATSVGLYRLHEGRWLEVPLPGVAGRKIFAMAFDGSRLWAIVESQLVVIARDLGTMQVVRKLDEDVNSGLVGDARSGVWYWHTAGEMNLCRLDAHSACYRVDGVYAPTVDQDGIVHWVDGTRVLRFDSAAGTAREGSRPAGRVAVVDTGLPLDEVHAAPDGTLWLIAGGRLARLARTPVEVIPVPAGAVVPASGADVWMGSFGVGMLRVGPAPPGAPLFVNEEGYVRVGPWPAQAGSTSRRLSPAAAAAETRPVVLEVHDNVPAMIVQVDPMGGGQVMASTLVSPALWIGDDVGGWRQHPSPPLDKGSVVRGIARDRAGGIVVGAMRDRAGLYRFDGAQWTALPSRGEGRDDVVAMHVDDQDRIWIGNRGSMLMIEAGKPTAFGPEQGMDVGAIRAIRQVAGEIWVSGHKGVARFRGDGFDMLRFDERTPLSGMTGFAFDDSGTLWLGAAQGIVRVSKEQWSAALRRPGSRARVTLYGEWEGVEHPIVSTAPLPTVTRTPDGRIWFYTLGAMYRIDPATMPLPRSAPPLAISSVLVDGRRLAVGAGMALPAGARRLVFAFHALSPVLSGRTAFRYRLVGLDQDWTEVRGGEVVLDRLPPGDYAFELQSSAEDGAWTGTPAVQAFSIPPTFWQSPWSKVLLAALVFAATAAGFMLRARQQEARRRALTEAKLKEREKIARDMHDTLLQGVNGLLMTMHAAVTRMDGCSPERGRLEDSIGIAERILEEGRDRVSALRSRQPRTLGLAKALQIHARDLAHERRILCEVRMTGEPVPLVAAIEDEMVQIGREALSNAFFHACATSIVLDIAYAGSGIRIEVSDNGTGLRTPTADREHWGILGMSERAAAIDGHLEMSVRPEGGTLVTLVVPAHSAYLRDRRQETPGMWQRIVALFRAADGEEKEADHPAPPYT